MNRYPIHLDENDTKSIQHGKILVVGTYVFSVVGGITFADVSGKAIADLGDRKIKRNY